MAVTRRDFSKLSVVTSLAAATGLSLKPEDAQALNASLATLLVIDPLTLSYMVYGPCCYLCPDHLIVSHYQPVALCEVIKGGGDTALGQPIGGPLSVGTDNNDYTSMHVRLWELPDWAIDIAMAFQSCKLCGVNAGKTINIPTSNPLDLCGAAANALTGNALKAFNSALPACFPKLIYDTEFDPTWNTGCRDLSVAAMLGAVACSNPLTSSVSVWGAELCVGTNWGPLYPRQMASHNDNAAIAAGIAAYRAIHVSGFAVGSFPFNAAISVGKLQQTSPGITVGFGAGSLLLDTQMRLYPVSLEEIYTFVWWVPVVCCKSIDEIMGFCEPQMCGV
ncbi:hypothetical protein [Pseudomonas arcuscaelestis]|uniref:hypothetical protein n=1 Tax=Pseudomonas arcuscaelestis TaxID=2710591 RepID=UPI001F491DED|nr:hypothetical protein [Pseudomonas arcuscaelestis]